MQQDFYKTIASKSEGFFKAQRSKFYAFAYPVNTDLEIKELQKALRKKYYDARHHVYAFRLGADKKIFRASDDGEPSNSSGPPILGQIRSYDLTNILIVVIRYFGGKKLGIPGLINAYKTASEDAIKNAKIISKTIDESIEIKFDYNQMNFVMNLIDEYKMKIIEQNFTTDCKMKLSIRKNFVEKIKLEFTKIRVQYLCELRIKNKSFL